MDCFALEIADQVPEHTGDTIGNDMDLIGNRHQRLCLRIVIGPKKQVRRTDSPLWEGTEKLPSHHQKSPQGNARRAMRNNTIFAPAAIAMIIMAASCSDDRSSLDVPKFEAADLQQGRATWMQVCRNCHLMGVAGAPAISDYSAWEPRIAGVRASLYANAIQGIGDKGGWRMPPRGGNDNLSDDDVRRAVDFMIAAVEQLRD